MSVVLEAIKLNHDPGSAHTDALNIRRNAVEFVDVPEWQRGVSASPQDSPAAYAIGETASNTITIQAKFKRTDPSITTAEVRALDPSAPRAMGCLYEILRRLGVIPFVPPPYGNCLGEVKARTITFPASGETGFETFELVPIWPLGMFGLGIYTVAWQWQYRLGPGDPWTDITTTNHRIYLVLEVPNLPWLQSPYHDSSDQLPWTDALDKACFWASKAANLDAAAERITRAINTHPLQSYTPGTNFGWTEYFLTQYLQALDGGASFSLNCTDCADAVTTFANLLGCDLVEGRFFDMVTRRFLPLNGDPSNDADWASWTWGYHEICWLGSIDQYGQVYDGCLQLDMDDNYADTVHIRHHPVKMRFGMTDPNDYRYRLIESGTGTLQNIPRHRPVS